MSDIVEQAARVIIDHTSDDVSAGELAQALADAGLLAEPARTVPTREEIVAAVGDIDAESWPNPASTEEIADAVLALMADQPTVTEVKAQTPEPRIEWKRGARDWTRGPLPPRYETAPVEAHATCAHCGTVTVTKFTAPGPIPQPLLKCDCQQIRDGK